MRITKYVNNAEDHTVDLSDAGKLQKVSSINTYHYSGTTSSMSIYNRNLSS